ncbi:MULTISPECIES: type VI secretion system ImpA family N-terminal domain-containing protein [Chromobacterium]|nr:MULTISPECIES: type VI secretion system ImpA family N-terminal domain-containing protein [Chromobacterium]MBK0414357.1 type VI secretion system ImpA family N-terminal domain-containing protein [Chromobacterium haemolyticum]MBO0415736.1 type VI secretion system ImpA family N-terminal domain-containing protein [Chromobacterium haemolyticum]MBO0498748.1 type VI secretion system ImpA family N-terminal domain-containing protein [Chromobacterium haemolyticum]MDH0343370.1 type VI secretion system Im
MSYVTADIALPESPVLDELDFDADFARVDAAICEYDAVGHVPLRKGAEPFHWTSVESTCRTLLSKAADVRVGVWLLRAAIAQRGLAGAAEGLAALGAIAEQPLENIRPAGQPDAPAGETHALHLAWLCGPAFLHQLAHSRLSADSEVSVGQLTKDPTAAGPAAREQALRDLSRLRAGLAGLTDLSESEGFAEQFDCAGLIALLDELEAALTPALAAVPEEVPGLSEAVPAARALPAGALKSREEVAAALDLIVAYFREHEPGHPAPIFLLRAKRMLGAGFEELMAELFAESDALVAKLDRPRSLQG